MTHVSRKHHWSGMLEAAAAELTFSTCSNKLLLTSGFTNPCNLWQPQQFSTSNTNHLTSTFCSFPKYLDTLQTTKRQNIYGMVQKCRFRLVTIGTSLLWPSCFKLVAQRLHGWVTFKVLGYIIHLKILKWTRVVINWSIITQSSFDVNSLEARNSWLRSNVSTHYKVGGSKPTRCWVWSNK